MSFFDAVAGKHARLTALFAAACLSSLLTGCLSVKQYVDPTLPHVSYADLKPVVTKQPVQLFFEYQTKGTTNAKVTELVRPMLIDTMTKSALFSDVVVSPAAYERQLFITINNFPVTKDASTKGFMTGLTFGLAGTMVTDGFMLTAIYKAPGNGEVKHSYQHALHSTIGNASGPAGLTPVINADRGIREIMDGLMLNLLKDMNNAGELQ